MGINKIQIEDEYELEALFRKHYHFLCTAAYYIIGDESTAKDIVQDFFYYCWKKREEINISGEFRNYASRAIRNACLNYLKSSRRTSLLAEFVYNTEASAGESVQNEEEGMEERNKALWAAIDRLPEQRRIIFLLSNKEDLTYSEIGRQLNISVNTVKTQIRLAYKFLRDECSWLEYFILFLFLLKK